MNYKEHMMVGVAITLPTILMLHFTTNLKLEFSFLFIINLLFLLFLGPLVMDLDHHAGKLREVFTFIGLTIGLIGAIGYMMGINVVQLMVIGIFLASLGYMLCYVTKHRGITHSIAFTGVFTGIMYVLTHNVFLVVIAFISVYSHLIGDKIYFKIY